MSPVHVTVQCSYSDTYGDGSGFTADLYTTTATVYNTNSSVLTTTSGVYVGAIRDYTTAFEQDPVNGVRVVVLRARAVPPPPLR